MLALRPRLRRFAAGLSGSLDVADDIVQATYERAIERLDQWQDGTRLDSWMLKIAHNVWLDRTRRDAVRRRAVLLPLDADALADGARVVDARTTLADVRRIMERLPDEQRAALLLVAVEGLSYLEAAAVMNVPIGTLTSRLARARLALKAALATPDPATRERAVGSGR
jgi:RNA polymerase sigma-70 factor (ECF subfamily)